MGLAIRYGNWPPLKVGRVGWLRMQATVGAGLSAAALAGVALTIRFRRGVGNGFIPLVAIITRN